MHRDVYQVTLALIYPFTHCRYLLQQKYEAD